MTELIGGGRPVRGCAGCGQVDDHPRDTEVDMATGAQEPWHLDCHAARGCASCAATVAAAGGATGAALLSHLTGNPHSVTEGV